VARNILTGVLNRHLSGASDMVATVVPSSAAPSSVAVAKNAGRFRFPHSDLHQYILKMSCFHKASEYLSARSHLQPFGAEVFNPEVERLEKTHVYSVHSSLAHALEIGAGVCFQVQHSEAWSI